MCVCRLTACQHTELLFQHIWGRYFPRFRADPCSVFIDRSVTCFAEERKRLCSFVVVGGGPTGVEFSAELHDFLYQDIRRMYPALMPHFSIKLVEGREILSSFDANLRDWAKRRLLTEGVEIVTGTIVCLRFGPIGQKLLLL